MQRQVPIREVNQHLSHYIESVEKGEEIIITKRGKAVAVLSAISTEKVLSEEQIQALNRTRARMKKGYHLGGRVDREQLHER